MVMKDLPKPRADVPAPARRFPAARQSTRPAPARRDRAVNAAFKTPAAEIRQSPRPRALAGHPGKSAHAARDDEPRLDALLRPRPGRDRRRFRRARHAADASRNCSTGSAREFIRRGWSHEGDAPADRHERDLSAVVEGAARPGGEGPAQPAARAAGAAARRGRDRARRRALPRAACSIRTIGGPSVRPPQPDGVYAFTQNDEDVDRRAPAPTASAAALYTLFYPQRAVSALHDVRRAGFPDRLHAPRPLATRRCRRSPSPTTRRSSRSRKASPRALLREVPDGESRRTPAPRVPHRAVPRAVRRRSSPSCAHYYARAGCRLRRRRRGRQRAVAGPAAGESRPHPPRPPRSSLPRAPSSTPTASSPANEPAHELESAALQRRPPAAISSASAASASARSRCNRLLDAATAARPSPSSIRRIRWPRAPPHFAPKAKRVIYLFMAGGPSQLELFDDKPKLRELQRPDAAAEPSWKASASRSSRATKRCSARTRKFERYGQCGMTLSELLPHHRKIVDDVCWLRGHDDRRLQSRPGEAVHEHRLPAPGRPEHGLVGHLRPRQRVARSARLRRAAKRAARPARRRVAVEQRLSAHVVIRACRSAARAIRSSICAARRASRREREQRLLRRRRATSTARGSTRPATRRSSRASTPTRWPSACRPARRS